MKKFPVLLVIIAIIILTTILVATESVESGHVKIGSLFGKVDISEPLGEGIHLVNPLKSYTSYDGRQKTQKITASVPSRDQLTTTMQLSIQYRMMKSMAGSMLKNTGSLENAMDVHILPTVRSLLREETKTVENAEDFFKQEVQGIIQTNLLANIRKVASTKGIEIQAVLIRDITLPQFITKAIEKKKEREQLAAQEVAELERYTTEQKKISAKATSRLNASKINAEAKRIDADAEAYANKIIAASLSPKLIQARKIEKWNGIVSKVAGGNNSNMLLSID